MTPKARGHKTKAKCPMCGKPHEICLKNEWVGIEIAPINCRECHIFLNNASRPGQDHKTQKGPKKVGLRPITKSRGISIERKKKDDISFEIGARKLREEMIAKKLSFVAPPGIFYLSNRLQAKLERGMV